MNRQTILERIDHHLRESFAETGEERPLGEIVSRVVGAMRSGSGSVAVSSSRVIPIEMVAAFVDGNLKSPEVDLICEAVMVDDSVLAEVIAAIRARQIPVDALPPLSASLSAQLLAMNPMTLQSHDADACSVDGAFRSEIMVQSTSNPSRMKRRDPRGRGLQIAAGLVAIAATIAIGIFLRGSRRIESSDHAVVVESDGAGVELPAVPSEIPTVDPEPPGRAPKDSTQSIVENNSPAPRSDVDAPKVARPDSNPAESKLKQESQAIAKDSRPENMPIPKLESISPLDLRPGSSTYPENRLADFRWTEVSGLLAQRNEASRSTRAPTWSRIREGSLSSMDVPLNTSALGSDKIALRTFPYSRANGQFAEGGRIVMAGDTLLQITRGETGSAAEFDLMYGSIAMVDLAEGTTIKLQQDDQTVATLQWQSKATVVVDRQTTGIQIHVEGGQIAINDQRVNEELVRIGKDRTVEIDRAPKRLPRWIARPDETSAAERMILAQIADTDDLATALNRKIDALASSPRLSREQTLAMAKLANWQAAMSESNLLSMAGSRVPTVRLAALQRLAKLPESDPRYRRAWNAIERSLNDPQRSAQIRGWFRVFRNGSRPNAFQLEQMLNGLSSRDFALRVISDFMLRQFVRSPPRFDPSWTGETLRRAVNVYRDRAGLPIDRIRAGGASGLP